MLCSAKKWLAELIAQARRLGWQQVRDPSRAPPAVAEAARSPRSMLLLHHHERRIWLSWHRWTESSTSNGRSTSHTHDLTRYLHALHGIYPDMSVVRRTAVGGLLKERRGVGTGDADFDRKFLIKPTDSPHAAQVITPSLAQALKAGEVPEFSIAANFLCTGHSSQPDWRELQPRAEQLSHLARLLTSR